MLDVYDTFEDESAGMIVLRGAGMGGHTWSLVSTQCSGQDFCLCVKVRIHFRDVTTMNSV